MNIEHAELLLREALRGQLAAGWYKRVLPATVNLGTGLDTLRRRHATLRETFELAINGRTVAIDAPAEMPVLWVLRDLLVSTRPP